MKQYISKLVLSLSVVALLFNCETEELSETNNVVETPPKSTIHKITHNKIIKNKTLSKQLSTLTKAIETHNKQHKTVYSSAYNFYINTDYATYIENPDGEGHTYTFNIQRDTETPVLENLVLSSTDNNNYTMHLVTYNITAQEKERLAQGDVIDLNNKVSSVTLDDAGLLSGIFNKETTITCLEIAISYCKYNNGAHSEGYEENGSQCPGYAEQVIATVGDCDNSSNGNSTGNTDTTNDNTNDPTNTTNNNTNTSTNTTTSNGGGANTPVTNPTFCEGCPEISEDDECPPIPNQLLNQLETTFGIGNVNLECDTPIEDAQFDSIEGLLEYFNNIEETSTEGETTTTQLNTKKDDRYFKLQTLPALVKLKCVTKYELPTNGEGINLISVTTSIIGNESISHWTSDDEPTSPTYTVNEQYDYLRIQISGNLKTGLYVPALQKVVGITKSYNAVIKYKYTTGEFISAYLTAVN